MNPPHPKNEAYFYKDSPQLFCSPDGRYLRGLAVLFGAHRCWSPEAGDVDHTFVDDKCTVCSIQRKPYRHLID